jgi:hypothetical protein
LIEVDNFVSNVGRFLEELFGGLMLRVENVNFASGDFPFPVTPASGLADRVQASHRTEDDREVNIDAGLD